ncbi:S-adenosyl methyltransferase [Tamaricihabitans halophyticus]|uniref:S-adenosyl methyltransferase n=1 Tax=Tamaricihabitans halophyticus TaxID=1262583 RepID=A0A4R2QQB0_9PSEU|nr:SAM-dependent methyltransferase [Tamaricihabitans halophyticus]TCP51910.1 S-adenosyl methyltransferase [Tamaricihabitans halophyticus]
MSEERQPASNEAAPDQPSIARIYDYLLGGGRNYPVDRQLADYIVQLVPDAPEAARANRDLLHRMVRFLLARGVRQFLDIGSGVPAEGNVHEIAQRAAPGSRVVYADVDEIVVSESIRMLEDNERAGVVHGDLCEPESILHATVARDLLNFDEPMAILCNAVLHFVPDQRAPYDAIRQFLNAVPSGSYLAISHASGAADPALLNYASTVFTRSDVPIVLRDRAEITEFFRGTELLEPGVVYSPQWHPDTAGEVDDRPDRAFSYAGVGRKP